MVFQYCDHPNKRALVKPVLHFQPTLAAGSEGRGRGGGHTGEPGTFFLSLVGSVVEFCETTLGRFVPIDHDQKARLKPFVHLCGFPPNAPEMLSGAGGVWLGVHFPCAQHVAHGALLRGKRARGATCGAHPPPPLCPSNAYVQATLGVGSVNFWSLTVAWTRGGG